MINNLQDHPNVTYRHGASSRPQPVLSGSGLRVQTVVVASQTWGWSNDRIADEYGLSRAQVEQALAFYAAHKQAIDMDIQAESELERSS